MVKGQEKIKSTDDSAVEMEWHLRVVAPLYTLYFLYFMLPELSVITSTLFGGSECRV